MKEFLTSEELIAELKKQKIDLGKGDPYNRLRYYTKIGWIPHMIRKKHSDGNTKGHYHISTLDRIILIQKLRRKDISNDEIERRLRWTKNIQAIGTAFNPNLLKQKILPYGSFLMITFILLAEMGVINVGSSKNPELITGALSNVNTLENIQILDTGSAFIPNGEKRVFIRNANIHDNSRIYITFIEDYSPATRYWAGQQISERGFSVELDTPVLSNIEFNWWITN